MKRVVLLWAILMPALLMGASRGKSYFPNLVDKTGAAVGNVLTAASAPVYRVAEEVLQTKGLSDSADAITRGLPQGLSELLYSATRAPFQILEGILGRPYSVHDRMYWKR